MHRHRTIRSQPLAMLASVALPTLAACQGWGEQLYVAYDTKLGIDASVNTATSSGSIDLGYDRRFVTWVPRSVELEGAADRQGEAGTPGETGTPKEVMSVLACSELRVGFIDIDYYDESLATGRAAKKFANALRTDPKVAKDYFACFTKRPAANEPGSEEGGGQ